MTESFPMPVRSEPNRRELFISLVDATVAVCHPLLDTT
jgi:hypothetical protein